MILLDTHTLIWWINDPKKLSKKAFQTIEKEKENDAILVSSITVWEIYLLLQKKRFSLSMDTETWFGKIESLPFVRFVPVDNKIAAKSVTLPNEFHQDPADRIIVATAREEGAIIITNDDKIRKYSSVRSLW